MATSLPAGLQNSHQNGGRVFRIFVADPRTLRSCWTEDVFDVQVLPRLLRLVAHPAPVVNLLAVQRRIRRSETPDELLEAACDAAAALAVLWFGDYTEPTRAAIGRGYASRAAPAQEDR
jgi:hypothetical protein